MSRGKTCVDITLLKARYAIIVLVMKILRGTEERTIMRVKTDEELKWKVEEEEDEEEEKEANILAQKTRALC